MVGKAECKGQGSPLKGEERDPRGELGRAISFEGGSRKGIKKEAEVRARNSASGEESHHLNLSKTNRSIKIKKGEWDGVNKSRETKREPKKNSLNRVL